MRDPQPKAPYHWVNMEVRCASTDRKTPSLDGKESRRTTFLWLKPCPAPFNREAVGCCQHRSGLLSTHLLREEMSFNRSSPYLNQTELPYYLFSTLIIAFLFAAQYSYFNSFEGVMNPKWIHHSTETLCCTSNTNDSSCQIHIMCWLNCRLLVWCILWHTSSFVCWQARGRVCGSVTAVSMSFRGLRNSWVPTSGMWPPFQRRTGIEPGNGKCRSRGV